MTISHLPSWLVLTPHVLPAAMAVCMACAVTAAAGPPPVPQPVREAVTLEVEKDWVERDSRYLPNGPEFSLAHSRSVAQQARKLAARLAHSAEPARIAPLVVRLDELDKQLTEAEASNGLSPDHRRALYLTARRLARSIAFCNPLLNFDKLLFLKRHEAAGVFHMCDQYYGCNAVPGGGVFVLSHPFSEHPQLTNLLEDAVVERGRLTGKTLADGSFLSLELSADGTTLLFAHSEAKAWAKYQGKEAYEWSPDCAYHLFRCSADGTDLVQLTDGSWDDFDPCFLPDGRVVFISERRGGYLRCGRNCPVYTLHRMNPDGTGIERISHHETHEWHPSVNHDGMLVYSRWDYVDRDTNIAHHPWTCYPDGRDPRSFHGNYPVLRESRPWMEMSIRAVPGSHKYIAVAGAHHGHALGSLVLIDPSKVDDNAAGQLERVTPDVPFPEAEGRPISQFMVSGTPWPLSEDDYLCIYAADGKNHGIYWIDRHGNRELIYRDPVIGCSDPIPLRPRIRPPIIPDQTSSPGVDQPATVTVVNVYDSDFPWPEGTTITALRIIQLLPKSTPPPNQPRIGIANQTNARAVLGTVPVEDDGSAYFEAPAGIPLYFQALNEKGLAVQSMRSATYLHPGERMACHGCHEPKHRGSGLPKAPASALLRSPSRIQPDVDGSNPFSFVRLVQPVLDRHCVGCHREKKVLDLSNDRGGPFGWTRSYSNLAEKYGFYFHVSNGSIHAGVHGGSRTIAGEFGAMASPLQKYLDSRHYGVRLSDQDYHRVTLWLDCNSEFYGAYENIDAQARGEVVQPSLK